MDIRKIIKEEVSDFEWAGSVPSSDKLPVVSDDDFLDEYMGVISDHPYHMGWYIDLDDDVIRWTSDMLDGFYFDVIPHDTYMVIEMVYDNPFDPHSDNIKEIPIPKFNYIEQIEPWINDELLTDIHVTIMKWIDENQGDIENFVE
jgi:hypothetical protein